MTCSERTCSKIVPNGCSFSSQCLVIQAIAKSTRDQIMLNIINNYTVIVPRTSHDWVGIRERPRIRRVIREWNGIRSRIRWQSRIRIWQRGRRITNTGCFTENAWTSQLLPNYMEKRAALVEKCMPWHDAQQMAYQRIMHRLRKNILKCYSPQSTMTCWLWTDLMQRNSHSAAHHCCNPYMQNQSNISEYISLHYHWILHSWL